MERFTSFEHFLKSHSDLDIPGAKRLFRAANGDPRNEGLRRLIDREEPPEAVDEKLIVRALLERFGPYVAGERYARSYQGGPEEAAGILMAMLEEASSSGLSGAERDFIEAETKRADAHGIAPNRLDEFVREVKAQEAASINEAGYEAQLAFLTKTIGLGKVVREIGESRPADEVRQVIVYDSPHDEDEGLPWIYDAEAFAGWFNEVFASSDVGPEPIGEEGSIGRAIETVQTMGYNVHVC